MKEEQFLLLNKAKESIKAAKLLLNNDLPDFATTRAYYAMFYVAEAFLLKEGLTYSSHAGVISAFGKIFAKTKRIPIYFHRYLIEAQQKRTEADYNLKPNITSAEAQDIINKAEQLLDFAEKNIELI